MEHHHRLPAQKPISSSNFVILHFSEKRLFHCLILEPRWRQTRFLQVMHSMQWAFIFWCWVILWDSSYLFFRVNNTTSLCKTNFTFLEFGVTPSQYLWMHADLYNVLCLQGPDGQHVICDDQHNVAASQQSPKLDNNVAHLMFQSCFCSILGSTPTFFSSSKVNKNVTTNEVRKTGCQWIRICLSEKTVCPRSTFPIRQIGSQSVRPVKLDMLWLPWRVEQAHIHLPLTTETLSLVPESSPQIK